MLILTSVVTNDIDKDYVFESSNSYQYITEVLFPVVIQENWNLMKSVNENYSHSVLDTDDYHVFTYCAGCFTDADKLVQKD